MKKIISSICAAALLAASFAGCSPAPAPSAAPSAAPAVSSQAAAESKSAEPVGERKVVIYSNTDKAGEEMLVGLGKEIGIDVTVVCLVGGGEVVDRLTAEKNSPTADIAYGVNHIGFSRLKAQDVLTQFKPTWADEVGVGLKDPEGYYYGVGMSAGILAYNADILGADSPKDWPDLWENEKLHGKYFINPSTSGSTTQMILAGILVRYRDDNGELGISKEGWDAVANYYKYGYIKQQDDDFYTMMSKGTTLMGQNFSGGIVNANKKYNANFKWATPEVGVPFAVEMVGIVKGCKNPDAAKEFLDYYGSAAVISKVASNSVPTIESARGNVSPELKEVIDSVKVQDIDYDFVAKNLDKWLEKIELELIP